MSEDISQTRQQMGKQATKQQREAANPDKSVWVEASAGTGKTKVLSDRVLRILLNGVLPAKILCLTYTKAAAVEMSSRIASRLSKWAVASDEVLTEELMSLLGKLPEKREEYEKLEAQARKLFAVLLDTPGGMKIQTIHSFCQEILKRFPLEAKISPYFEVMDDRSSREALDEIKKHLLQKIENEPESVEAKALSFLTEKVSEYKFPDIMNSIAENRNKITKILQDYNSIEGLLSEIAKRLNIKENDTEKSLQDEFWERTDKSAIKLIMEAWFKGAYTDVKRANLLSGLLEKFDFVQYMALFLKKDGEPFAKAGTKGALDFLPQLTELVDDEVRRLQEMADKLLGVKVFNSTKAVLLLAQDLIGGYNNYKKQHSKLDYEDLIVITRKLLENSNVADWVLFKLDGGIDNVLIDEAQDTSPNQWAIIRALTEDFFAGVGARDKVRTVFAVGDRKQSIYSFQGADPQEFENMRQYFKTKSENFDEVHLDVSFRSTAAILDAVNVVFADEEVKKGVVNEEQTVTHIPFRVGEAGKIELWPLIEPMEGENQEVWLPPVERKIGDSTSSRLARQIALRIKEMVEKKELLISQNRPLRYKDFMILVQRRNSFVEELVRECKNVGVNIAGVDKIRLLEQISIQDLIAVGKFLLLPTDDLTLATILKSPLFGLNDDDLFELCYKRGKSSVWSQLGGNKKYVAVYNQLQELLNMADYVRPFELYSYILTKMQGRKKFVERMGEEVEDGIDEFVNLTLSFEVEHIPSLQKFIEWISQDEIEIKRELEQSDADVVRIMTVHGSKGLQSPVVIMPDTVRVVSTKKESGMLWDEVCYFPLSAKDYDNQCRKIKEKENLLQWEEYKRLLYVALTRAEDRLCICGYKKKNAPSEKSWYEICKRTLAGICVEDQRGELNYSVSQQIEPKKKVEEVLPQLDLPKVDWIYKKAEADEPLAKPYTPSKPDDEEDTVLISPLGEETKNPYRRGSIIHKLLQFIPDIEKNNKAEIISEFLNKNVPDFSDIEKKRIQDEVIKIITDKQFSSLFSFNSKAEVPIMGEVDGKIVSAVVDRLVVEEKQVLIVDFKTNRPAAKNLNEVPKVYLKQMQAYKKLLQKIYPDKTIRTVILWTNIATLMEIN